MRQPRLKPVGREVFYHVYNRCVGTRLDLPFGLREKAHFLTLLHRLLQLYTLDVLAFTVMGNHYHLIVRAPQAPPTDEETCDRYAAYYDGKRTLRPGSRACRRIAARLPDISWLLHDLQHQFASWFNRSRPVRRRGSLWAGRFKHTVLEAGLAVWDCWAYIEMNPVRAGLVRDPADYPFCSFGQWCTRGTHPYPQAVEAHLIPRVQDLLAITNLAELKMALQTTLATQIAESQVDKTPPQAADGAALCAQTTATRHIRYWTDGLIIGSKPFIREIMANAIGSWSLSKPRFTAADAPPVGKNLQIFSYRRLRNLPI